MKTIEIYVNIQKCTSVNVHKVYHMFTTWSHIVKEKNCNLMMATVIISKWNILNFTQRWKCYNFKPR